MKEIRGHFRPPAYLKWTCLYTGTMQEAVSQTNTFLLSTVMSLSFQLFAALTVIHKINKDLVELLLNPHSVHHFSNLIRMHVVSHFSI